MIRYWYLKRRMVNEFGYTEADARDTIKTIRNFDKDILKAFKAWLGSDDLGNVEVMGISIAEVMKQYGYNPIAAFIYLNWLKTEPEKAKRTIARGFDTISELTGDKLAEFKEKVSKLYPKLEDTDSGEAEDDSDISAGDSEKSEEDGQPK